MQATLLRRRDTGILIGIHRFEARDRIPAANLSQGAAKFRRLPGVPKTFFRVTSLKGRLPRCCVGKRGWVSSMIELIATAAGVASAFIFLMHAIDAYRA